MKKATIEALIDYLDGKPLLNQDEVLAELKHEIAKSEEAKQANAELYESAHETIVGGLTNTPCTCAELYESIKDDLPEGINRYKLQYALNNLWETEIVKIPGKPNTYRRA